MPHELTAGLEAGAVVLLVLLLVPKRSVDHLRSRLSDLRSGRHRRHFQIFAEGRPFSDIGR